MSLISANLEPGARWFWALYVCSGLGAWLSLSGLLQRCLSSCARKACCLCEGLSQNPSVTCWISSSGPFGARDISCKRRPMCHVERRKTLCRRDWPILPAPVSNSVMNANVGFRWMLDLFSLVACSGPDYSNESNRMCWWCWWAFCVCKLHVLHSMAYRKTAPTVFSAGSRSLDSLYVSWVLAIGDRGFRPRGMDAGSLQALNHRNTGDEGHFLCTCR